VTGVLDRIIAMDMRMVHALASLQRPWLIRPMRCVTLLGSSSFCVPAYIFCLVLGWGSLGHLVIAIIVAECVILPVIVSLRYLSRRERPAPHAVRLWEPWNRYSFPSHHAARSWMLVLLVSASYPGILPVMLLMALLVTFSRLYLQKHFLSDVLVGIGVGIFAAVVAYWVVGGVV
jgi:undecaprenyl-diphosphatase